MSGTAPLLEASGAPPLAPERFYMLGIFFVLMANQCLFWFTFSADPPTFESAFPGLTIGEIDQLLNWGPITFVPTVPVVMWLLQQENGLRKCLRLNASLAFSACALRLVPCLFTHSVRAKHHELLLLLHAAQILNGIAGPVLIAAPSRLSALWFPPRQRTTVTAIANASFVGAALGFFLCPAVLQGNPDNVPALLGITLGMSCIPLVCVACYCPDHPAVPPSAAVVAVAGQLLPPQVKVVSTAPSSPPAPSMFCAKAAQLALGDSRLVIMMLVTALSIGVYDGWVGLLPQILHSELPSLAPPPRVSNSSYMAYRTQKHSVVEISPGVDMPKISLGTCCGSNPAVGLPPWLEAGGVGIDTAFDYNDQKTIAAVLRAAATRTSTTTSVSNGVSNGRPRESYFLTTKIPATGGQTAAYALHMLQVILHGLQTCMDRAWY